MKPSEIIQMARNQTGTWVGLVTQPQAYDYLNIILADFWKDITDNNTGLGLNTWNYDLTANTNAYVLPDATANTTLLTSVFGIYQLTKIGIRYSSSDTNYTPASLIYVEGMLNLPEYYAKYTPSNPLAIATDTTITIFPTPTSTITNGLQLVWPKMHFPLGTTGNPVTTEDSEDCILIPAVYHYVLVEGLKYRMYGHRGTDFETLRQNAKSVYESEKDRVSNQMMDRMQESSQAFMPDLSYLS